MTTMSVDKAKGSIFDPGLCRCCGSMKRCRVLNEEYQCNGQKEVYSDIIIDCFGIMLSHLDAKPASRLVCATCVRRLREAAQFRAQVLRCEAIFLQLRMSDEADENHTKLDGSATYEVEIKLEPAEKPCGSPAPDELPDDPPDLPDDPGDLPDDPTDPTDAHNELKPKPKPVKAESCSGDSDDAPLRPRKRRPPPAARALPPLAPGKEKPKEKKITREEAEVEKHRTNIKTLLECSNATPIRCYSGVGYKCCYCSDLHKDPKKLKTHTLTKHDVKTRSVLMQKKKTLSSFLVKLDITELKCQLCNSDVINSIEELMEHLSKHKKKLHKDIQSHILPFKFDDGLKCAICPKTFTKFKRLQEHMNLHFRNYICDVCETGYPTKKMLRVHFNMHITGVFQCAYCPKTFNTNQKKQLHEKQIHVRGSSNFLNKCGVCHDRFKCYTAKEEHMLKSHGLSSAVKCQACDKTFQNQRNLNIHVKRDHLMRRPHKCPECEMSFFKAQQLKNHLVKHTGVKAFKCEVCLKCYGRKKTLREHMRIHAADRRFQCQHCGLGFVQKCSWRGHMRSKHSDVFVE